MWLRTSCDPQDPLTAMETRNCIYRPYDLQTCLRFYSCVSCRNEVFMREIAASNLTDLDASYISREIPTTSEVKQHMDTWPAFMTSSVMFTDCRTAELPHARARRCISSQVNVLLRTEIEIHQSFVRTTKAWPR
jgi:hypothetical protein